MQEPPVAEQEFPAGVMGVFEAEMAKVAGVVNTAEAQLVALTAWALAFGLWVGWRIHTPQQWLRLRAGVGQGTADKIVRLARRFDELPTVMALHREGRLSLDQAATIARYTPADYEASVAELAELLTVDQIVRVTSKYCFDTVQQERDQRAKDRDEPKGPKRQVRFGNDSSDQWTMRASLPADEGALVEEALKDHREKLHQVARERAKDLADAEGRPTTGTDAELGVGQPGWADALVGMAKVAATTNEHGESVADRVGVLLHLEAPEPDLGEEWKAEMHMGPTLPSSLRRYLTCDCDIEVVWHQDGRPVQVGRQHRIVPRRIRRLVMNRDKTCRVPGCTHHLWLQVHHIIHWEDDGETITANQICLCSTHHRQHHQGLLGIVGDADATTGPDVVTFTTLTGERLSPAPHVRAPHPDDMPDVAPYEGPCGERLDPFQIHLVTNDVMNRRWRPPASPQP